MRLFDDKFQEHKLKYIIQSLMAAFVMLILGLILNVFLQTTIIASIGATVFIVFTMPHTKSSKIRYVLGGYTIGITVGSICSMLLDNDIVYGQSILVAVAVGISIFIMVVTNMEHPPAVAMSMGIVIGGVDLYTIFVIYICLITILLAKRLLSKWMINLL